MAMIPTKNTLSYLNASENFRGDYEGTLEGDGPARKKFQDYAADEGAA
jgi:hypothetical protein